MKTNRSNRFTQGIVITNNTNDKRFLFFELDHPITPEQKQKVLDVYRSFGLDVLWHRTGNGIHFLSPTLITLETWKEAIALLKDINKKCPMTTLRWLDNDGIKRGEWKYPFEPEIWFTNEFRSDPLNIRRNSDELSNELNQKFHSDFMGNVSTELKFVRYPLP